jgi:hypothetical protein
MGDVTHISAAPHFSNRAEIPRSESTAFSVRFSAIHIWHTLRAKPFWTKQKARNIVKPMEKLSPHRAVG